MDTKTLAALLNGREYREEVTDDERAQAKRAGIVIVYGASDDLCEFDGAINDEADCCNGGLIQFDKHGLVSKPDREERATLEKFGVMEAYLSRPAATINARWDEKTDDGRPCSWCYSVNFPHETFDVMEDGQLYCQGIVFNLSDALPTA
jgi:hypothetical protein